MNDLTHQLFAISRNNLQACRIAFFLSGAAMGAWAPLVPFARERAGIDDGELGLLLLCLGSGSMCMMPFVARLVSKVGCRAAMTTAVSAAVLCLLALSVASQFYALVMFLLCFGACMGTADVTMNLQGSMVERGLGRTMMSGFHGLFSVGNIFSALLVSALLGFGLSPLSAVAVLGGVVAVLLATFGRQMLAFGEGAGGPIFSRPTRYVWLVGILCLIAFLVEGSMLDWSAVFLTTVRGMDISQAGIGYALFSVTMAIGRLSGDWLVPRLGERAVLVGGSALAMFGMLVSVLLDSQWLTLVGFVLVGAGIANMVPVYCSAVGRQHVMPVSLALSTVNAIGYLGILMGPAAIGFVAHLSSLSIALVMTAGLLVFVMFTSTTVVRHG
ncbi:MFS transporter [Pseudomonas citrulli]|uniref:MFS transporter n=1 Tax=Pseudomonas citrulli TaxID=3064347 RepID=A0ABT9BYA1_9PSED|nr:MFS transporter [Pseudomonas sp. K18]MDO7897518.1 MFS transporter [Pseudomonas sp. K18]